MCLVCSNIRIWTPWPSSSGVSGQHGTHWETPEWTVRWHRVRRHTRMIPTMPRGVVMDSLAHGTHGDNTEYLWPPNMNNRTTEGSQICDTPALPVSGLRLLRGRQEDMRSRKQPRWIQKEACSTRNYRGFTRGSSSDDTKCMRIWRGGEELTDAASQCPYTGSESGPSCSPGPGG